MSDNPEGGPKPVQNDEQKEKIKQVYSKHVEEVPDGSIKKCQQIILHCATERDAQKRLQLSQNLTEFLTQPDGVKNLSLALIDFDKTSQKLTTYHQRFQAISRMITRMPKLSIPYEQYCDNIVKQLKILLTHGEKLYQQLGSEIFVALIDSPHAKNKNIEQIVFRPIFSPLNRPDPSQMTTSEAIVSINTLIESHKSPEMFVDIFPNLFYSLVTLKETKSHLSKMLLRSLVAILKQLKTGVACCLIERTLFSCPISRNSYTIDATDECISVKFVPNPHEQPTDLEREIKLVLEIFDGSDEPLPLDSFFYFQDVMRTTPNEHIRKWTIALLEPMLEQSFSDTSTKYSLLSMVEKNADRLLELIARSLVSYLNYLRENKELPDNGDKWAMKSLENYIEIMNAMITVIPISDTTHHIYRMCMPVLGEIQSILRSRGECSHTIDNEVNVCNKLIEGISGLLQKLELYYGEINERDLNDKTQKAISDALKDLNDHLVPVRVHGIITLKQMITSNDKLVLAEIPRFYQMIESTLADAEPYVFLASINLVVEMALRRTDFILPKLVSLHSSDDLDTQQRINVGEALVKLFRQTHETTPHYAQQVMGALYSSCKSSDELIRMSSLTNIGTICKSLGDSLGKYIVDVLQSVRASAGDESMQVRCAAVDLLRSLLSGLNKFKAESVQRELKEIYGLLKSLKFRTLDETLSLQIELALDELDLLAKDMLGVSNERGQTKLVKEIKVLSLLER